MPSIALPYGDGERDFKVPSSWQLTTARPTPAPTVANLELAISEAVQNPWMQVARLRDRVEPGQRVSIAITDATRPSPDSLFLNALLHELKNGGVSEKDITLVFALGMHRRTTEEEQKEKLGAWFGKLRTVDAHGGDLEAYRALGELTSGATQTFPEPVPVELHEAILDCDVLLATGIVEPHQYAGFSGGRKTVAIGCASANTISVLHGVSFLEHSGTRLGRIENNPVHEALVLGARKARLQFIVNLAMSAEGEPLRVLAGEPEPTHEELVRSCSEQAWVPVGEEPFDAVVLGIGSPKDANLYQASRALTYLAFGPRPPLREGGWVVIAAPCPEGMGQGAGEQAFLKGMQSASNPIDVVAKLRADGFGAGGQRAFMVAKALTHYRGAVLGASHASTAPSCHMKGIASLDEIASVLPAKARVLVVPHGLATLPLQS
ncbi:MAG: nickel-dependent lactate racemase [Candidatus Eisenbacteria bacterium]|uniref:Nickel-dependent lactate racemase n=1 Tax=Eiseniibacteriota bacterium TaxID=2212470 RepID=A0A7Y2E7C0_UNCEI|nr:nickel-dependent lactate racemase [Candidatus Eisenbacteria bacterium]